VGEAKNTKKGNDNPRGKEPSKEFKKRRSSGGARRNWPLNAPKRKKGGLPKGGLFQKKSVHE